MFERISSLSGFSILIENSSADKGSNGRYYFLKVTSSGISISQFPIIGLTTVSE